MKMSVLYHSKSGNTKRMAEVICDGMMSVEGVEAKAISIDELDMDWIKESKCVVMGTPIYMASLTAKFKTFLENEAKGLGLAGKIGGAFATVDYVHGGGEFGIRTILDHMMVFGMMTFSGGISYGRPVIHLGPVAVSANIEDFDDTFTLYGQRMAIKTVEVFK